MPPAGLEASTTTGDKGRLSVGGVVSYMQQGNRH